MRPQTYIQGVPPRIQLLQLQVVKQHFGTCVKIRIVIRSARNLRLHQPAGVNRRQAGKQRQHTAIGQPAAIQLYGILTCLNLLYPYGVEVGTASHALFAPGCHLPVVTLQLALPDGILLQLCRKKQDAEIKLVDPFAQGIQPHFYLLPVDGGSRPDVGLVALDFAAIPNGLVQFKHGPVLILRKCVNLHARKFKRNLRHIRLPRALRRQPELGQITSGCIVNRILCQTLNDIHARQFGIMPARQLVATVYGQLRTDCERKHPPCRHQPDYQVKKLSVHELSFKRWRMTRTFSSLRRSRKAARCVGSATKKGSIRLPATK
ncbi:unknown [Prevotella sp. CAG:617]|nr:unknown [Prevotella sp. CAG:617]